MGKGSSRPCGHGGVRCPVMSSLQSELDTADDDGDDDDDDDDGNRNRCLVASSQTYPIQSKTTISCT